MPFYQDAQFNIRPLVPCASTFTASLVGTGTAVAIALTAGFFPVYVRRTAIRTISVTVLTAPVAGVTAAVINFTNGTNTFAIATIGTLTAGQVATVVPTVNNTFADAGQPLGTVVGTVTSAGTGAGGYAIWLDEQELYE
jgi:hypothetical protein